MNNKRYIFESPFKVFLSMVGLLLILFLLMEGWRYSTKPTLTNNSAALHQSLNTATKLFYRHQQEFLRQSRKLSQVLQSQIQQGTSHANLYPLTRNYPMFWGITLVQDNEPVLWDGFTINFGSTGKSPKADSASVKIRKQNNVLYWFCDISFSVEDTNGDGGTSYQLYTARLIEQDNALPMQVDHATNLLDQISRNLSYPVKLSVFDPIPAEGSVYTILKNSRQDSIGIFYASPAEYKAALETWEDNTWFWRSVFLALCFLSLCFFLYLWADQLPNLQGLLLQLLTIGAIWLVFHITHVPERWVSDIVSQSAEQEPTNIYPALSRFIINSIFFFLVAFTLNRKASREAVFIRSKWYPVRMFVSALVGLVNVGAILLVIHQTYSFATQTQVSLLGLRLLPPIETLLFFLGMGLAIYSIGLALVSINRLILRSGRDQHKLIAVIIIISFVLGLILAQLFIPDTLVLNWAFVLALAFFFVVFGVSYLYKTRYYLITRLSTLRILAIGSLLIAMTSTTIIYNAYSQRQDQRLLEITQSFNVSTDPNAKELTTDILEQLSSHFQYIIKEGDPGDKTPFLQAQLTQTVEQLLKSDNRNNYSVDVHLLKSSGEFVAAYSTDLNSPDWVSAFNLRRLNSAIRLEQVDKLTPHPIVQRPEIDSGNQKYKTFYRGWIPIYGTDQEDPVAWVLCSVYNERPDFDKPIRSVLAALSYDDVIKSYQLLSYRDNQLVGSNYQGVTTRFPTYHTLLEAERQALRQDSVVYYTNRGEERTYRNLLLQKDNDRVIKASTIAPDFRNILFSFFRFNFIMLFAGALVIFLAHITNLWHFTFLGKSEHFKDRIADNFLVATLIFLTLLVVATHIAIKDQNKNIVRQELFDKLGRLTQVVENSDEFQENYDIQSPFLLDSLTTPLNIDASFYRNRLVSVSTTPQIYHQHILPSSLPFPIYQDLYVKHQRDVIHSITLAGQEFLVGYRSIFSPNNEPVAAVAIPTFVHSPKYDQQLLETTSYLIILYFFVFGLFIIGTALVSQQLTRPLHYIQEGLNEISQGNLNTTIPVTSNDEIGSLASAYNEMVYRLKELQEELAKAERESAWKEMAQQVAHEIKNPLTPMKLSIQHLQRQLASDRYSLEDLKPRIQKITANIIEQIQSLNAIASDFSKFSKPVQNEFNEVSVNEILNSVTDLYQHDEKVEIKTNLSKETAIVNGVADELQRVVINLVKNAYEAMPEGGLIMLRSYCKGNSVFIEIEDNGLGIQEKDKSKIFVPNFSTKSSGTGLGLAICKKIVEAHNGSISFASIEGKGTTFIIKLPLKS